MAKTIFEQREIRVARDFACGRHPGYRVFSVYAPKVIKLKRIIQHCGCITYDLSHQTLREGNRPIYITEENAKAIFPSLLKVKPGTTRLIKYISVEV